MSMRKLKKCGREIAVLENNEEIGYLLRCPVSRAKENTCTMNCAFYAEELFNPNDPHSKIMANCKFSLGTTRLGIFWANQ